MVSTSAQMLGQPKFKNVAFFIFNLSGHHELSIYPKKELPFFILFTAALCSFTAMLALLTHQFPEPMANAAKTVSSKLALCN